MIALSSIVGSSRKPLELGDFPLAEDVEAWFSLHSREFDVIWQSPAVEAASKLGAPCLTRLWLEAQALLLAMIVQGHRRTAFMHSVAPLVHAALSVADKDARVSGDICHVTSAEQGRKVREVLRKLRARLHRLRGESPDTPDSPIPPWCADPLDEHASPPERPDSERLPEPGTPEFEAIFAGVANRFSEAFRDNVAVLLVNRREVQLLAQIIGCHVEVPWRRAKVIMPEYLRTGQESRRDSKYFRRLESERTA